MATHPKGKTGLHPRGSIALAAVFLAIASGPALGTQMQDLQRLGAQVRAVADQADLGVPPSQQELASLRRQLEDIDRAAKAAGELALERKYRSIAMFLARIEYRSTHPMPAPPQAGLPSQPALVDREVVTAQHGGKCVASLGLSEAAPVQATFGASGSGRADAWYHFEAPRDGYYLFSTRSMQSDPAIEILAGDCTTLRALARDDDTTNLDASASVKLRHGEPAIIHVNNAALGGSVTLAVTATGATISGTISDSVTGLPLANAWVAAISTSLYYSMYSGYTDQNGGFLLPVSTGTYYVFASDNQYVTELYPNALCQYGTAYYNISGCNTAQATPITVTTDATITGIDVALGHGQQISGSVRDGSNQPIPSAGVTLYSSSGTQLGYDNTDSAGRYSFAALPAAAYSLLAQASGYGSQIYDHVACGGPLLSQCDLDLASTINVSTEDVSGANFNLPVLATIQGTVTGPAAYGAQVCVLDGLGNMAIQCTGADANGHYQAGPLPVGTYYAYAVAGGFFSQMFNGVDCPQDCALSTPAATAITLSQVGQIGLANFQMHALPSVHGHVQDGVSSLPLSNVTIYASVLPPGGNSSTTSTTTDGNGDYTLTGTPVGQYYLLAQSNDHLDQIYAGIPCEQYNTGSYYPSTACDVTEATLLTIAPGAIPPAFNFALQPSSSISGKATTRAGEGSDLPASVEVDVYNGAGVLAAVAYSDVLGNYVVNDLPPGTYFAEAGSPYYYYAAFMPQIWQQIDCPGQCAPTTGTPILLDAQATATGVDFDMTRRDAVVGRVVDDKNSPLSGVVIDLFDSTSGAYYASGISDPLGYYVAVGSLGGAYFVATEAGGGYVDQVFSHISCPLGSAYFGDCALSGATPIGLNYVAAQPHIVNFLLFSKDTVFANGFEP